MTELTKDELIAGLRELLELQDRELRAKDQEIAALKRTALIRAAAEARQDAG